MKKIINTKIIIVLLFILSACTNNRPWTVIEIRTKGKNANMCCPGPTDLGHS